MSTETHESTPPAADRRVIKRYSNRKLYDTQDSRYVTLLQIADMVRAGEDVQILDNATKEDKTDVTLALIISEELKAKPRGIPLVTLKALIRHRGEKLLTQLREGPIGRLIPQPASAEGHPEADAGSKGSASAPDDLDLGPPPDSGPEEDPDVNPKDNAPKGLRATLEQWQHAVDERVRTVLPSLSPLHEVQAQLERLSQRLDAIEKDLAELKKR